MATTFDFTGLDDVQTGGQTPPKPDVSFDFEGLSDAARTPAKAPSKAANAASTPPQAATKSPDGTVKFDFDDLPAPSYKIQLEGTRPGDKAATGAGIKPVVASKVSVVDLLPQAPRPPQKVVRPTHDDQGHPYAVSGALPKPGQVLAPWQRVDTRSGRIYEYEPKDSLWETETKPGYRQFIEGIGELTKSDNKVRAANKALMGALTAARTPGLIAAMILDPVNMVLGLGLGTGSAEVVERVGEKVGADEDFTHLAANVAGLYAGGKGSGLVRGFTSVANDAAAAEAAGARAVRMRAERERVLPDLTPAVTARENAAAARVEARLGSLRTAGDELMAMSRPAASPIRALPPKPEPANPPVFTVDLPTGVLAAPEGTGTPTTSEPVTQRAKSITTEVERPVMPEGMSLKKIEGGEDYIVSYMTPSGAVHALISADQIGVEAPAYARAFQERTKFPASFEALPTLEKDQLRRIRNEMDAVQFERSLSAEEFEAGRRADMGAHDAESGEGYEDRRRGKEGNLLKVTPGAPVLHDIIEVGGRRYTRPQLIAAIDKFIQKGGKPTQPVKDALVVARRRLSGNRLEGYLENPLRPAALPEDAGRAASDIAHIPGFDDLVDPRAYLEAERDSYYQQTAVEKVIQYLGEGEAQGLGAAPRGVKPLAAVLKATPEIALATRERLVRLKNDKAAWKSLTPDVRKAVESQLEYLNQTLTPAMRARWVAQGQPGLIVFPNRNARVVAENPVATSVLPEPGRVGRPLSVVLEERGARLNPDGTIVREGLPLDADHPAGRPSQPVANPEVTPPPADLQQPPLAQGPVGGEHLPFDEPQVGMVMTGGHKDIRGITTVAGPVESVLLNHPLTRELMTELLRGADAEPQFVYKYTRMFADTHKGLTRDQMMEYSDILNRFERPEEAAGHYSTRLQRMYSEEAIAGAVRARELTAEIFSQFPENATVAGTLPQFIHGYLTHIERVTRDTPDILAGIQQTWDHWMDGMRADAHELFGRAKLTETDAEGRPVPPRPAGVGRPRSRFVEHRTGNMADIELDPRVIWPIYVKSAARVIVDKPVVDRVKPMLERLPSAEGRSSSKLRDLATQVVRNYSRYDAYPDLHRSWNALVRTGNVVFVRSVLGLSPRLALLHLARIQGVYAEMPNRYFFGAGLKTTLAHPWKAFNRTAEAGLLPNNLQPAVYRPIGTKLDNLLNFMGAVDFFDRSVALHGFEKMYLDMGYSPAEAYARAVMKTKKTVQFTDRVRYTFPSVNDSEIGRAIVMFKAIPVRILQQAVETARMAKQDPARAARHAGIVAALLAVEAKTGQHLIHIGGQLVHLEPPIASELRKIGNYLLAGDWQSAMAEAVLSLTPGGLAGATTKRNLEGPVKRAINKAIGTAQPLPGHK